MKKDIISFKIQQPKHRAHKALFDDDLPFKHKVEKPKKGQYHRRPKHRNDFDSWEDK
jgi:stalled ribosome alternative rescue factor ArfA